MRTRIRALRCSATCGLCCANVPATRRGRGLAGHEQGELQSPMVPSTVAVYGASDGESLNAPVKIKLIIELDFIKC